MCPSDFEANPGTEQSNEVGRIVNAALDAWVDGDLERMLSHVAKDVIYTRYLAEAEVPFAGETRGKPAVRAALQLMRQTFHYILFRRFPLIIEGVKARHQVEFMYRHITNGEMLTGRFRIVWTVESGLIQRSDEYHDAERIKAFMRLVYS